MKILILTTTKFAPTYNSKLLNQVEYVNRFSDIDVDIFKDASLLEIEETLCSSTYDLVYPTTVFSYTEDGTSIQSFNSYLYKLMDYYHQDYIGSPIFTHLMLNDKALTNFRSGIALPNFIITRSAWEYSQDAVLERLRNVSLPIIIKPNTLAASLGITEKSIVVEKSQLQNIIDSIFHEFPYLTEILAEKYLTHSTEYTVSITGNSGRYLFNISKLESKINKHAIFSYMRKNSPPEERPFCYVQEQDRILQYRLQRTTEHLFEKFKLRDLGRFDYLYTKKGELYLIDANTLPSLSTNYLFEYINNGTLQLDQLFGLLVLVASQRLGLKLNKQLLNTYPIEIVRALF